MALLQERAAGRFGNFPRPEERGKGVHLDGVLHKIQDTVGKYAQVLSDILKVDVEVVDEKLMRVAGTGRFLAKPGPDMSSEGHVYRMVIETGEKTVIERPGHHPACTACEKRGRCDETFEMSAPIKVHDRVIGVIGFVCFTEHQKNRILASYSPFMNFLEQISELIASKAVEERQKEETLLLLDLLENIIDRIQQGVIILKNNRVVNLNDAASRILGLSKQEIPVEIAVQNVGTQRDGRFECRITVNHTTRTVLGQEYQVNPEADVFDRVLIFEETKPVPGRMLPVTTAERRAGLSCIIGRSAQILSLKRNVKQIADSSSTVLITGESGTGKELFARAIHEESIRSTEPFVTLNCAAIPENLLESELFGYVKGAFTGADPRGKPGKFELANRGTLFLDEIGDLPLALQAKLLRAVERKEIERLGSNKPISFDLRIITATNRDLSRMVAEHTFREDLYYRLNVIPIHIPPLRERKEDIEYLARHFIDKHSKILGKSVIILEDEIWKVLTEYRWQGNVRELENTIEYLVNMADEEMIRVNMLPQRILSEVGPARPSALHLSDVERECIRRALAVHGISGKAKKVVARQLGISLATLYRKLRKYGLDGSVLGDQAESSANPATTDRHK